MDTSESTESSSKAPAAKPRWRPQYSLGTLIVACLLAGAGLIVFLTQREVLALRQKNREMTERLEIIASDITLAVNEQSLKSVLEYLSAASGKTIRTKNPKDEKLPVTFKLEHVSWRAVLDFIARKYGMTVDESLIAQNTILMDIPEKISMVFNNADIRDVINTIAIQANENIIIAPEVRGAVSMRMENVPWREALNIVARTLNFDAVDEGGNTIRVGAPRKITRAPAE